MKTVINYEECKNPKVEWTNLDDISLLKGILSHGFD